MEFEVRKPDPGEIEERGIDQWPVWEKEVSRFPWIYGETEECYLLSGRVVVSTDDGKSVEFGAGDIVRFPAGLRCRWDIKEAVKKHYRFK